MREYVTVGKGGLALILGRGAGILLAFIITLILTRMLGPEKYGVFSFVITIPLLAISILNSTLTLSLTKYIPQYASRKEFGKIKTMYTKILKLTIVTGFLTTSLLFILSFLLPYTNFIIISLPYLLIALVMFSLASLFYNLKKMHFFVLEYCLTRALILVFLPFLIIWFGVAGALLSYSIGTFLTLVVLAIFAFNFLKNIKSEKIRITTKKIFSISLPYGLSRILASFNEKASIFLLTYFAFIFGMAEVGYFNLAFGVLFILSMIIVSIPEAAIPTLVGYFSSGKRKMVQFSFNLLFKYLFILILPIIFSMPFVVDKLVLLMFGSEYLNAVPSMQILSLCLTFFVLYKLMVPVMIAYNKFNYFLIAEMIGFAAIIVSCFVLIPNYGSLGASIGYLIGIVLSTLFLFLNGLKISKIKFPVSIGLKIFASSLVFFLFFVLPTTDLISTIFSGIFLLGIYGGLLFLTHTIDMSDIKMLLSLVKK